MGSFWGLDNAGKEAQGWPREYGAWTSQQFKDWIDRQNKAYSAGDSASEWNKNYNLNRVNNGIGTIDDARAFGSMIMPGVNDYISSKRGRIQQSIDDFNSSVPSARDTMDKINASVNETGDLIRQNRDYALNDIGDTFARANSYEDAAHTDVDKAYDTALTDAELLKPSSEFAQAQTARSFAGMNASTAGGLRRAGIDLASPQGIAAMQRSQTAQARAMDDKAAEGTEKYVTNRQGLTLGKAGEATRYAGAKQGIDLNRSNRAIGVQDKTLDRATEWEGDKQRAALTDKALNTQDWQTRKDLGGELSNAELEAIGLKQSEYNAGMGYHTADLAERNSGAANVGNYGDHQLDYALRSGGQALANGNTAMGAYQTAYGYEAPQAGYGAKMLAAAGGAALDYFAPGVGTMLTGAVSPQLGAPQPQGGGYPGGGYPGGGGGGNSPYGGYGGSPYGPNGPYGTPPFLPQQGTGNWQKGFETIGSWFKPKPYGNMNTSGGSEARN